LPQLVQEIKLASANIRTADDEHRQHLRAIEESVNDLYRKVGRPGGFGSDYDTDERKDAAAMVIAKHSLDVPRFETTEYQPSTAQVDEAMLAMRGLRQLIWHGDPNKLSGEVRKSLSAFSFGANSFALSPVQATRTLSCLVDPSDLSGLVDNQAISGSSLKFLIDNARMTIGGWACEAGCFANNPVPELSEGLGEMDIKPETVRFVVCATSDLLEDASFDVEAWLFRKISEGMRATVNAAVLLGDSIGKPMGLLNPNSGIPICECSPATAPGQFSWQDLMMLKYEIPMQWMDGSSYLMNQRTFALQFCPMDFIC
jgi:HK97 family phage major capsid protein